MRILLALFVLFSLPSLASEIGEIVYARGVCHDRADMEVIAYKFEMGEFKAADDLFMDYVGDGRCEYRPMGHAMKLVKEFQPYDFSGEGHHLWYGESATLSGYLVVPDQ